MPSVHAVTRPGGAYPECVRALGAVDFAALGRRYLDHLRTLAPGAARVTDKLPGNYLHLGFIATILPGATIVHCRRDPLDNGVSLYFTDFMVGHEYSNDLRTIGRQIRGMRALMAHWEAVLGDRLLTLDYEALVADPEPLTRAMVAHVGLEWDDACLRPHEVAGTVRTASAWQVRQPVYRRSAGRARAYERFLGPLREGLGEASPGGRRARQWPDLRRGPTAGRQRKQKPLPEVGRGFQWRFRPLSGSLHDVRCDQLNVTRIPARRRSMSFIPSSVICR